MRELHVRGLKVVMKLIDLQYQLALRRVGTKMHMGAAGITGKVERP